MKDIETYDNFNDFIYIGPGIEKNEIDIIFKKMYEKLVDYKNTVFMAVERVCPNCDEQIKLAMNIAETDGELLKNLIYKECLKRQEKMKIESKKVITVENNIKLLIKDFKQQIIMNSIHDLIES